jgi:hypothetical protein
MHSRWRSRFAGVSYQAGLVVRSVRSRRGPPGVALLRQLPVPAPLTPSPLFDSALERVGFPFDHRDVEHLYCSVLGPLGRAVAVASTSRQSQPGLRAFGNPTRDPRTIAR